MNFLKTTCLLFFCTLLAFAGQGIPQEPASVDYEPLFVVGNGQNVFHKGKFGNIGTDRMVSKRGQGNASIMLRDFMPLTDDFTDLRQVADKVDDMGQRHVKVRQYINGMPVIGSEMIVHAEPNGDVFAINGHFGNAAKASKKATISANDAMIRGLHVANIRGAQVETNPKLSYVMDRHGEIFLAFEAYVSYTNDEGPQFDRIFVDATGEDRVVRHPQHHYVKNRRTYTANNGTSLPGSLVRTEGSGNSGDAALDAAHNNAGITYDYYSTKFGRDSYNNNGATLNSTVHYSSNYNNAFWNGSQMVYGDGDGNTFSPLSQSLDVVAHELTHAVTSSESNLVYSYESGALNEAMSDIFGAAAEAWADGGINSNTWKLAEDIYTPNVSGDAMRYMDDPAAAGDYDYYPTRYQGSGDNGGVHTNSGIANLAFVLLVEGGSHPRGKTSTNVSGIGLSKAEQIFYRANTVYLTSNSQFEDCRDATAQAAADLYGSSEVASVHAAWDAVGVPGGSGGGGGGGTGCSGYSETFTGSVSSGGQSFQPNGTYWYSNSGDTAAKLTGPSGTDFDLYLWKWNGSSWSTVASGTTASSTETTNYNGSAGYFTYRVHAYSGSGSYTLCVNR